MLITVERYIKVVHAVWSKTRLRNWMPYAAAGVSWICGITYNMALCLSTTEVIDGVCYGYVIWKNRVAEVIHAVWNFVSFYVVVLCIFVFCYWRILVVIRRQASVMASHSAAGSSTTQTQTNQIQSNVIKTMILVSAFYATAWLPYNVYALLVCLMLISTQVFTGSAYYVTMFMGFLYTSANPFIYATKLNPVRQILRKMICCRKSAIQATTSPCPATRGNQALK